MWKTIGVRVSLWWTLGGTVALNCQSPDFPPKRYSIPELGFPNYD